MILLISICKEKLHEPEFVKPIEDVLSKNKIAFFTKHFMKIREHDIQKADKVIIAGTSLKDNDFLQYLEKFSWLNDFSGEVFGICGGSHVLGLLQGFKLKKKTEIGMKTITLKEDFLGKKKGEKLQVYHLHQYAALPEVYKKDNYFAVLFHPEVRNKDLIEEFSKN